MAGFTDYFRLATGWKATVAFPPVHREICGTLSIRPVFQGNAQNRIAIDGTLTTEPAIQGTMEANQCRST